MSCCVYSAIPGPALQQERWRVVGGRGREASTHLVPGLCLAWWAPWRPRLVLREPTVQWEGGRQG